MGTHDAAPVEIALTENGKESTMPPMSEQHDFFKRNRRFVRLGCLLTRWVFGFVLEANDYRNTTGISLYLGPFSVQLVWPQSVEIPKAQIEVVMPGDLP